VICIEDPLRPEAGMVIASLRTLGIDEYHAQVLPEDKASYVEELRAQGRHVIMVGGRHQRFARGRRRDGAQLVDRGRYGPERDAASARARRARPRRPRGGTRR
jgi:hypothetical protein